MMPPWSMYILPSMRLLMEVVTLFHVYTSPSVKDRRSRPVCGAREGGKGEREIPFTVVLQGGQERVRGQVGVITCLTPL